jgi:hypothetical protein
MNRAYVIKTSTKLDVSAVKLDKITDAAFSKPKEAKKSGKKSEGEFFAQTDKKVCNLDSWLPFNVSRRRRSQLSLSLSRRLSTPLLSVR